MPENPLEKLQILLNNGIDIWFWLMGAVGGFVRVLAENKKYSWMYYLSQAFISGFTGYITILFIGSFIADQRILGAVSGIAGFAGAVVLHLLSTKLLKFIEKSKLL